MENMSIYICCCWVFVCFIVVFVCLFLFFCYLSLCYLILQDPRVLDKMLPYLVSFYGNPHSRTHAYGWESEAAMENARQVRKNFVLFNLIFVLFIKLISCLVSYYSS